MDFEQQKLAEDIQQIELVLKSTGSQQRPAHYTDEEEDSDEEGLTISVSNGLIHHAANELQLGPTSSNYDNELEEYDDSEEEADEDLGDTLETALKLNRAYQELLRMHMANIKHLLDRNARQQQLGQEQLASDMTERPKRASYIDLFSYPYFKDRWGSGPPKNQDTIVRERLFPSIELPKIWKIHQEELLIQCLEQQMKSKCLKDLHLRLKKCRQCKANSTEYVESEADLLYTINCVKHNFSLGDVPVEDVIEHADWLTIANHHLEGAFNTESCIALYRNVCNPLINRSKWTANEDEKLKLLVNGRGHQDWKAVGELLQTDRSPFLCLQRYQQALNDYETATWTEEKEELLYKYVIENMGKEDTVSWDKVAWIVGEMSPNECKNHWEEISKGSKRLWTPQEDMILIEAVKTYTSKMETSKRWMHIAAHVKTRNSMQCRDRWINRLNPSILFTQWSYPDSAILFDYIKQYMADPDKPKNYDVKSLLKMLPGRGGNSISQRLRVLQKKMNEGVIDEYMEKVKAKHDKEMEEKSLHEQERERYLTGLAGQRSERIANKMLMVDMKRCSKLTSREEVLSSGVTEGIEIVTCLRKLLAGYPLRREVSNTLRSHLETSIQLMMENPEITVTAYAVKQFLEKRILFWRHQAMARKRQAVTSAIDYLSTSAQRDYTPYCGPVKSATAPKTVKKPSEIDAAIAKALINNPDSVMLPKDTRTQYSKLIEQSMLDDEELEELRTEYSDKHNLTLNTGFPYLLPPNAITLHTFYQLLNARTKLACFSKQSKHCRSSQLALAKVKKTNEYVLLAERLKSVLLWPAVLSRCDPNAVIYQGMTKRKYHYGAKGKPSGIVDIAAHYTSLKKQQNVGVVEDGDAEYLEKNEEDHSGNDSVTLQEASKDMESTEELSGDIETPTVNTEPLTTDIIADVALPVRPSVELIESLSPQTSVCSKATFKNLKKVQYTPACNKQSAAASTIDLQDEQAPAKLTQTEISVEEQVKSLEERLAAARESQLKRRNEKRSDKKTKAGSEKEGNALKESPPKTGVSHINVNATTNSGKRLPDDVTAIILKALKEKDKVVAPVRKNYRTKPRKGPFDKVVLEIASQDKSSDQAVQLQSTCTDGSPLLPEASTSIQSAELSSHVQTEEAPKKTDKSTRKARIRKPRIRKPRIRKPRIRNTAKSEDGTAPKRTRATKKQVTIEPKDKAEGENSIIPPIKTRPKKKSRRKVRVFESMASKKTIGLLFEKITSRANMATVADLAGETSANPPESSEQTQPESSEQTRPESFEQTQLESSEQTQLESFEQTLPESSEQTQLGSSEQTLSGSLEQINPGSSEQIGSCSNLVSTIAEAHFALYSEGSPCRYASPLPIVAFSKQPCSTRTTQSPRKQTLHRKSISPIKPATMNFVSNVNPSALVSRVSNVNPSALVSRVSNVNPSALVSRVSPEKLRSVLKQIHRRNSPSSSSVSVVARPDVLPTAKTCLAAKLDGVCGYKSYGMSGLAPAMSKCVSATFEEPVTCTSETSLSKDATKATVEVPKSVPNISEDLTSVTDLVPSKDGPVTSANITRSREVPQTSEDSLVKSENEPTTLSSAPTILKGAPAKPEVSPEMSGVAFEMVETGKPTFERESQSYTGGMSSREQQDLKRWTSKTLAKAVAPGCADMGTILACASSGDESNCEPLSPKRLRMRLQVTAPKKTLDTDSNESPDDSDENDYDDSDVDEDYNPEVESTAKRPRLMF